MIRTAQKKQNTTLQGINISYLGKRKIIFKMPFLGDMLVPWRVVGGFNQFEKNMSPKWESNLPQFSG